MKNIVDEFVKWCLSNSWEVVQIADSEVPKELQHRYKSIPHDLKYLLSNLGHCISPDEKTWFLTKGEIEGESESAFSWNEIEKMSLETAEGDSEWTEQIKEFWDCNIPFVLSVRDGYSYYALQLKSDGYCVVHGCEPEFEEVKIIAESIIEFLNLITEGKIKI